MSWYCVYNKEHICDLRSCGTDTECDCREVDYDPGRVRRPEGAPASGDTRSGCLMAASNALMVLLGFTIAYVMWGPNYVAHWHAPLTLERTR